MNDIAQLRSAPAADEHHRYQQLKAQEGRQLLPPPGLEAFVVAGELPPQILTRAQLVWQQFVKEVRAGSPMGVHDKLFFLSVALAQTLLRHGGPDGEGRRRAVIETAIEALASPQHRYQLRSMLARDAVRHGDLVSADAWLAGCDPRSYDIHVDSDYRVAAACVATARGNFASILHQLGRRRAWYRFSQPVGPSTTCLSSPSGSRCSWGRALRTSWTRSSACRPTSSASSNQACRSR